MTTLNDLIEETRRILYSNEAVEANLLNANIGATDTTLVTEFAPGNLAQRGALCSIDLEHIRVWGSTAGNILTIQRGVGGTTAAAHTAGAYIEVQPRFSPFMCMQAINEDLDDLGSPMNGLYQVQDLEVVYNAAVSGYDMTGVTPDNVIAIQELRYKIPGPSKHLPAIRKFDIARTVPTSDYPSGMALLLEESAFPGLPIHVRYRSTFNHFVNLTDDAQTVAGLPTAANGLPALGAAIQLMVGREVKRNFTESTPDPLQLELVTGGQVLNSYKGIMLQRQARIQAVAAGLVRRWGAPLRVL